MRYHLICDDSDTYTGLRMAGITGVIVHSPAEVLQEIENAVCDKDIAVLIITEKLASTCRTRVDDIRLNASRPLVAIIPGADGSTRPANSIMGYIRDAIGVKLDD